MINLPSGPSGITKDPEVAPLLNRETSRAEIRKQQERHKQPKRENWDNREKHERRKTRKPQKARKPWKRESREKRENRKTAKPRRLAHNCLLHFQALSASFCFSIFSCSRFSWFSPVFSCLCISSFWPQRANFLLRLCEPALISPHQQWSIYLPGYFWSSTKRPWSCTTFQQGTGWEEWFNRLHIPNSVSPLATPAFFRSFKKLPNIPSPFGQPGNARVGQLWWV